MRNTAGFDEKDIKYLEKMFGRRSLKTFLRVSRGGRVFSRKKRRTCELIKNCLMAMQEFGENRWWLSNDKRNIAYYQFQAKVWLVPFDVFHEALTVLLGRYVWTHEIYYDWKERKKEAERAFNGTSYTYEKKKEAFAKSIQKLEDLGMEVINVAI